MRTDLSAALESAYGAAVQKPAWLVYIGWAVPYRASSWANTSYAGQTWSARDVDVSGLTVNGAQVDGSLVIGNADDEIAALLLVNRIAGTPVRIYGYDAAATAADADFIQVIEAVGGDAEITPERATIRLRNATASLFTPRTYVTATTFGPLISAGTRLRLNGQNYVVTRGR
jgi:hypothetical protein